jgi:hypothetical protein
MVDDLHKTGEFVSVKTETPADFVAKQVGFRPIPLSDQPFRFNHELHASLADSLNRRLQRGSKHEIANLDDNVQATIDLNNDGQVPYQHFGVNQRLVDSVRQLEKELSRELTENELYYLHCCNTDGVVEAKFSDKALNNINALYYQLPTAFSAEVGLATMFVKNSWINKAIGKLIDTYTAGKSHIKVKEICSGGKPDKWQAIASAATKPLSVELTDFVVPPTPDFSSDDANMVDFSSSAYSLFETFPTLPTESKVDVMMSTYGFDSVWLDADRRYVKKDGKWYRELQRIRVLDSHPKKAEMIKALQTGQVSADLTIDDFGSVMVEFVTEEVTIDQVPYGQHIKSEYEDVNSSKVNFPGGLIARVVEAFDRQLQPDGIFVIGDVGVINRQKGKSPYTPHSSMSGLVARYKVENYDLAKKVLESEYGLEVEIQTLDVFVNNQLGTDWQAQATEIELKQVMENPGNFVMVVRRAKNESADIKVSNP